MDKVIISLFQRRGMYVPLSSMILNTSSLKLYHGFRSIKKADVNKIRDLSIRSKFEYEECLTCAKDIKNQPLNLINIGWSFVGLKIGVPMTFTGTAMLVGSGSILTDSIAHNTGLGVLIGLGSVYIGLFPTIFGSYLTVKSVSAVKDEIITGWNDYDEIIKVIEDKNPCNKIDDN